LYPLPTLPPATVRDIVPVSSVVQESKPTTHPERGGSRTLKGASSARPAIRWSATGIPAPAKPATNRRQRQDHGGVVLFLLHHHGDYRPRDRHEEQTLPQVPRLPVHRLRRGAGN